MNNIKVYESEYNFCKILWENEPITSGELVKLCREKLEWKKSTTYTVIRRLTDRGIITSQNTVVTSLVSKEDVNSAQSIEVVDSTFDGSLPEFIAAFTRERTLSEKDIEDIKKYLNRYSPKQTEQIEK